MGRQYSFMIRFRMTGINETSRCIKQLRIRTKCHNRSIQGDKRYSRSVDIAAVRENCDTVSILNLGLAWWQVVRQLHISYRCKKMWRMSQKVVRIYYSISNMKYQTFLNIWFLLIYFVWHRYCLIYETSFYLIIRR